MNPSKPKVFGLGLSKTGTTTLGACFERLGYDHFSWNEPFAERVLRGDVEHAIEVAERHDSFEDLPWPYMFAELDARFPNAKFVLTVRKDPETWFRSLLRHAEYKGRTEVRKRFYGFSVPHGRETEHIEGYLAHNDAVRAHFASRPDKLLEVCWEYDPGWKPLCDFLGHEIPDTDIPHRNQRRKRRLRTVRRRISYTLYGMTSRAIS